LRNYLPNNWLLGNWQSADRTSASSKGPCKIIAVVWNERRIPYFVSLFIVETTASFADRNEAIARIGEQLYPYLG